MVDAARSLEDDARIGAVLQDRYRVERLLARGGMGAVYEAVHVRLGKRVAIKTLLRAGSGPEAFLRFEREARAASAIGHPGIIDVRDLGELPDGTPYMALELLEGRDWDAEIRADGPAPIGRTIRRLLRVCDALGAAHAAGVVHRDLKPANVFLVGGGEEIKLLDFGVARFRPEGVEEATLTRTGATVGTVRFMSPEQAKGEPVDARADLWALGVILFQALTGRYPFDDASLPMLIVKICTDDPPSLRAHRPDVPEALESVLLRLLAREPEARFPSCAAVAQALAPFAALDAPAEVRAGAPDARDATPRLLGGARARADVAPSGRRGPIVAAIVAIVALGGGLAWWAVSASGPASAPASASASASAPASAPASVSAPASAPASVSEPASASAPAPAPAPVFAPAPATGPDTERASGRAPARAGRESRGAVAAPAEPAPTPVAPSGAERGFRTTAVRAEEF